jgi:hypothetical protein
MPQIPIPARIPRELFPWSLKAGFEMGPGYGKNNELVKEFFLLLTTAEKLGCLLDIIVFVS